MPIEVLPSLSWLNPVEISSTTVLIDGVLLGVTDATDTDTEPPPRR